MAAHDARAGLVGRPFQGADVEFGSKLMVASAWTDREVKMVRPICLSRSALSTGPDCWNGPGKTRWLRHLCPQDQWPAFHNGHDSPLSRIIEHHAGHGYEPIHGGGANNVAAFAVLKDAGYDRFNTFKMLCS
jgi:hypothetical protein